MSKRLAVLIIHGMGSQVQGYEHGLVTELHKRMEEDHNDVAFDAVYWQDITEQRQVEYLDRARQASELDWFAVRRFVATALGDAAAYQFGGTGNTYELIHKRIQSTVKRMYEGALNRTDAPLVILAHSLGSHIISNYIWDMQQERREDVGGLWEENLSSFELMETLSGFVTFGSNIPLFSFAFEDPTPIDFPGEKLSEEVRAKAEWRNYFDPDDVLGYPLRPLSTSFARAVKEDIEIDAGSWGSGLTPLSHVAYWTDRSFTRPVAAFLDSFLG